jgi:hypothetical protein
VFSQEGHSKHIRSCVTFRRVPRTFFEGAAKGGPKRGSGIVFEELFGFVTVTSETLIHPLTFIASSKNITPVPVSFFSFRTFSMVYTC